MSSPPPLLISCGILKAEVMHLIEVHGWQIDTLFLPSSLHFDFEKLDTALSVTLQKFPGRDVVVVYGVCHPFIDRILEKYQAKRIPCQNCVEVLLGGALFTEQLSRGAYFLLEEWARSWEEIMTRTFGSLAMAREIFQSDRRLLLAVRTPCSGEFSPAAQAAAASIDVPLEWLDVGLENLESSLVAVLERSATGPS